MDNSSSICCGRTEPPAVIIVVMDARATQSPAASELPADRRAPEASAQPLYLRLAQHYRGAIRSGVLVAGARMPSVRAMTRLHRVSLSTALQACRSLEGEGLLEARPRSGYFVRKPRRSALPDACEPDLSRPLDAAQYVGVHDRVSNFVATSEAQPITVDFASACAAPQAYPADDLKSLALRALRRAPAILVQTAPSAGDASLRSALARRALDAGMHLTAADIVITQGCIEALNIALRAVTSPGDTVAVESPTYYGLLQVLESLGLRALEIPTSPRTGLSIDALELALRTHPVKAVAVVPNFQNPLASVMPDEHKQRLVALCDRANVALIEDDTYGALADDNTTLSSLKAWDRSGNVIHCASLRKTLAPGMRVGWISGGRRHARIQMLKYAQSRANDSLAQRTVGEFIASTAFDRHLVRLRRALRAQREQVAEAIAAHFPEGTRSSVPQGSMMLWVELPAVVSSERLFDTALAHGIRVVPGSLFSNSDRFDHFMRIGCGQPFSSEHDRAVRALGEMVCRAMR